MNEQVASVDKDAFKTTSGKTIFADIKIWSAGIKADSLLKGIEGLEVNGLNQLVVKPTLQTTVDDSIFAFGDCAYCVTEKNGVPPSAQAAHQQACLLAKSLPRMLKGLPLLNFKYNK